MMWNGEVSGIYVKADDRREFTVPRHLRPGGGAAPLAAPAAPRAVPPAPRAPVAAPPAPAPGGAWRPIVDANETVLADRPLIDCSFQQPKTMPNTRGRRPSCSSG